MGESKFLYRPATKELRSHVEAARLDYEPKVRRVPDCQTVIGSIHVMSSSSDRGSKGACGENVLPKKTAS